MSHPSQTIEPTLNHNLSGRRTRAVVIIVGNGPVGMRAARELLRRNHKQHIIIYGEEQHPPYHRVKLSSFLAGDMNVDALSDHIEPPEDGVFEARFGSAVIAIDPSTQTLQDSNGQTQSYQTLILATGSRAHIPALPGIKLPGVFTFRDLDDATRLLARQARSHHTVVLGGGLLGLEAARAMQRANTRVTLIEHTDRLLGAQLDEGGSQMLQQRLQALGIEFIIGNGVRRILGQMRLEGLELINADTLHCDTLVLSTGIRPRIELARAAGIAIGKGIRVNDSMQTSVKNIYAIGECAEHRGKVYGLVAPGLEHAAVAASHINAHRAHYSGSIAASRLKVAHCPVFSAGPVGAGEDPHYGHSVLYTHASQQLYRKIVVHRHRLIGAIGIGAWSEDARLQQAVSRRQYIAPWRVWRFKRTGLLWPEAEQQDVTQWPAATAVCQCTGVSRGAIEHCIRNGADSLESLSQRSGAGSVCGACRPLIQQLLGAQTPEPVRWHRALIALSLFSLLASLAFLILPAMAYTDTVQARWRWDVLWRDPLLKQISGFSILGLFSAGLLLSARKRLRTLQGLGRFDPWRLAHILLGVLIFGALLAHTGAHLGSGLNRLLMLSFTATLLLGAVAGSLIGLEHRIGAPLATRLRRQSIGWHILMFWPVPVLLGFHILKGYWY